METFVDIQEYHALLALEKKYLSLKFIDFFYKKLETEYHAINSDIAQFRIVCVQIYSTDLLQVHLLSKLRHILDKLLNSSIYQLLLAEYKTLECIMDTIIAVKELNYKNSILKVYETRNYYKKWTSFYPLNYEIHNFLKGIIHVQLERIKFIFSIPNNLNGKLDKIKQKIYILGITENGLKKYTCMPTVDVQTGLDRFPVLYSNHARMKQVILPGIISIFYYWKRLNCTTRKLNTKIVNAKNEYLPSGTIIGFKDSLHVYEMLLLDSRIFVVLISGLKEHSSIVSEGVLVNVLKIWASDFIY